MKIGARLKRYYFPLAILSMSAILALSFPAKQEIIKRSIMVNVTELLSIIPPIFVLMGLADVYVPRETVVRLMGEKSALVGVALSIMLGSLAAGPLYAAFPIASMMMRKGASFFNVMVFVGAWSTLKVPMFLFETISLGVAFSVTRWITNVFLLIAIAAIITWVIPEDEQQAIISKQNALS